MATQSFSYTVAGGHDVGWKNCALIPSHVVRPSAWLSEIRIVARSAVGCSATSCTVGFNLTFPIWKIASGALRYFSRTWKQVSAIRLHPNCMSVAVPFVSRTSASDSDGSAIKIATANFNGNSASVVSSGVSVRDILCLLCLLALSLCCSGTKTNIDIGRLGPRLGRQWSIWGFRKVAPKRPLAAEYQAAARGRTSLLMRAAAASSATARSYFACRFIHI